MSQLKTVLREPTAFARFGSNPPLRRYQKGVMDAVFQSVLHELGFSYVVMFPRQSGKNELQAHLELYLMTLLSRHPVELVKVTPTVDPQARTGMQRFERMARRNPLTNGMWKKEGGKSYKIGQARLSFLSAATGSNIVGATASGLLEVDEAQQVSIQKFDRDVSPMAASTNATHVFWGTAWTSNTLLGRELRAAMATEKADGIRRVFRLAADDVYTEVPDYRKFVEAKIARQGRNHPMIRTQYFSEEVDGTGGMFPPERLAKLRGFEQAAGVCLERAEHRSAPTVTALLLDVAGEDEGVRSITGDVSLSNPSRDATALTLVEIGLDRGEMVGNPLAAIPLNKNSSSTQKHASVGAGKMVGRHCVSESEACIKNPAIDDLNGACGPTLQLPDPRSGLEPDPTGRLLPIYRPVKRWQWIGVNHAQLHGVIREIALEWNARTVVVDATGVGAGLASFLDRALPGRVIPFTFSNASKSELGWRFLDVVDSCRWQEPVFEDLPGDDQLRYQNQFFAQLAACQFEVKNDAKQTMHWGVPDGSRDPVSGELLHDDWVLSAALCAVLEKREWGLPANPILIQGVDPLEEMDKDF